MFYITASLQSATFDFLLSHINPCCQVLGQVRDDGANDEIILRNVVCLIKFCSGLLFQLSHFVLFVCGRGVCLFAYLLW